MPAFYHVFYLVVKWLFEDLWGLIEALETNNWLKKDFVASWKKRLMPGCRSRLWWLIWRQGRGYMIFRVLSKTNESILFVYLMFNISLMNT